MFSKKELEKARELAYHNWTSEGDVGFEYEGTFVRTPFWDVTGRFEFGDLQRAHACYGKENVNNFIRSILFVESAIELLEEKGFVDISVTNIRIHDENTIFADVSYDWMLHSWRKNAVHRDCIFVLREGEWYSPIF